MRNLALSTFRACGATRCAVRQQNQGFLRSKERMNLSLIQLIIRLLAVIGGYWRLLAVIGGYWRLLAVIGGYWRLLAVIGRPHLPMPGGIWLRPARVATPFQVRPQHWKGRSHSHRKDLNKRKNKTNESIK
jgi:hypothetical protein